ncbi:MAG: bifunctional (p)ppGpp synthetase/guanosine-3',5'-bis(diphosphate) 3'-pyrophosphohydrolase [Ruminococcaceae bacterium]|nr:bifunctional (p)ppGpp synthetase/guanosine-3',5'-bis(diphosphate) 3'-pyrophosphohydrolase [Oscillospiraceae bacterium]
MSQGVHTDISRLLEILRATGKKYDLEKIKQAFEYARELHCGQFRVSGEEYISHPIAVAEIVAGLELDTDSICAALLHDTVEDCSEKTDLKIIEKMFGADVAVLVDGLTKIVLLRVEDKEEAHIENLRKMLLAMSKDVRVIFIKLCDRLHNMRTLNVKPDNKRRLTALETMHVYAPLAHRLGMQRIKQELENLSLQYLDPIGFEEIRNHIEEKYGQNLNFIESIRASVSRKMEENKISFTLEGRIKSVYSIYRKMYNQNKSFDEIYDFYALRIIVETELECYTALGLIHEMFNSIPGRFKDYISTPKPNMYRSLHTTVIGRDGIPFEVQIRTREMHHIAEYGIAAHWKYKSGATSKEEMDKKLAWIASLIETEEGERDPDAFMNALKTDIFHDEVFVFTPKGDVIALPNGANLIDFAYAVHSAVGNKMIGGKINGMIVPIDHALQNGEIVEILTSSSTKGPSRDWLSIVKTSSARAKIRAWFKKEKRSDNIAVGRSTIDAELRKICGKAMPTETQKEELIQPISTRFGYNSTEDFYNAIGYGGLSVSKVLKKLQDECAKLIRSEAEEQPAITVPDQVPIKPIQKHLRSNGGGIVVDGEYGCMVKFAKCCNPLPGDDVIGFVTKGFGISIHKTDCPNVIQGRKNPENADRWKEAFWELPAGAGENHSIYEAFLQIYGDDRIGMLADITVALADMRVSILQVNVVHRDNDDSIINLKIGCKNIDHYNSIVSRLRTLNGVNRIARGFM